ncbi:hypothetical protein V8B55DRAFT_1436073 [Mucor lusitanicus]
MSTSSTLATNASLPQAPPMPHHLSDVCAATWSATYHGHRFVDHEGDGIETHWACCSCSGYFRRWQEYSNHFKQTHLPAPSLSCSPSPKKRSNDNQTDEEDDDFQSPLPMPAARLLRNLPRNKDKVKATLRQPSTLTTNVTTHSSKMIDG